MIARSYWHTFGLPVAVTRFANLYGGGDLNRSRLVPEAIGAALAGRAPVIRSDGSPERDFLYVEDAVEAYLLLADALDGPRRPARARRGVQRRRRAPHAVRDVVARICALAGADVEPDIRGSGTPAGEIDRQYVDAAKLRMLTGWEPQVGARRGPAPHDRLVPRAPAGARLSAPERLSRDDDLPVHPGMERCRRSRSSRPLVGVNENVPPWPKSLDLKLAPDVALTLCVDAVVVRPGRPSGRPSTRTLGGAKAMFFIVTSTAPHRWHRRSVVAAALASCRRRSIRRLPAAAGQGQRTARAARRMNVRRMGHLPSSRVQSWSLPI